MTLEVLFAQAAQGRTFLLMLLCGAALALGILLAGGLHRRCPALGHGADLLLALGTAITLADILLQSGAGIRLYALLGLCIGAALALAGIWPVLRLVGRIVRRISKNFSPAPAGKSTPHAE